MKLTILIGLLAGSLLVSKPFNLHPFEKEAFEATNKFRAENKQAPLKIDTFMCRIAREHSEMMANGKTPFGHDGFSTRTRKIQEKTEKGSFGENVYMASWQANGTDAVNSWIASDGHRENMLTSYYSYIGIGLATGAEGTYYTQIFSD